MLPQMAWMWLCISTLLHQQKEETLKDGFGLLFSRSKLQTVQMVGLREGTARNNTCERCLIDQDSKAEVHDLKESTTHGDSISLG